MRGLEQGDQQCHPDRAQPGNLPEQLMGRMFLAFRQQLPPCFLRIWPRLELLIELLRAATHARFR